MAIRDNSKTLCVRITISPEPFKKVESVRRLCDVTVELIEEKPVLLETLVSGQAFYDAHGTKIEFYYE